MYCCCQYVVWRAPPEETRVARCHVGVLGEGFDGEAVHRGRGPFFHPLIEYIDRVEEDYRDENQSSTSDGSSVLQPGRPP